MKSVKRDKCFVKTDENKKYLFQFFVCEKLGNANVCATVTDRRVLLSEVIGNYGSLQVFSLRFIARLACEQQEVRMFDRLTLISRY